MPGKQYNAHTTWNILSAELEAAVDDWQDVEHPNESDSDDKLSLDNYEKPLTQLPTHKHPSTDRIEGCQAERKQKVVIHASFFLCKRSLQRQYQVHTDAKLKTNSRHKVENG